MRGKLAAMFRPRPTLTEEEFHSGMKWWTREGAVSLGFHSITTSGLLAAYALALGCNNLQIGILASIPFLVQPLQILFIPLVERIRWRKAIAVSAWIPAQLLWIPIALIPFFADVPGTSAVAVLLIVMAIRGVFHALSNCAWNGWIRDLVPQQILAGAFARRLARATTMAMVFGLGAAFFVDFWKGSTTGDAEILGYTFALLFGIIFLGLVSPIFMCFIPEPLMQTPAGPRLSLSTMLITPFRDRNFRHLLRFLFFWGIALNLAIPFFAVYMLERLGLPISAVIGFSVLSQTFNILFLSIWGGLADRFGIKTILYMSASLYLLVILCWVFTTMPEKYSFTIPLLAILHMLAGIASAGVTLGTGTIGMKLAPEGQATSYLAVAAMATSLGAGLGPLLGGLFADYFSERQLSLTWNWVDPNQSVELPALYLTGFDFLFGIAFFLGLMTLNMLLALREEGEVGRDVVLDALFTPGRQFSRPVSSVPWLNFLGQFPYGYLRRVPLPGLDVAVGVTAYQIAETAKIATAAAVKGGATTRRLTRSIQESLAEIGRSTAAGSPASRFEVARQAMRGVVLAMDEARQDMQQLTSSAIMGVLASLGWGHVDPHDALRGASYGAVQGAMETGGDPGQAAVEAVEAAREMARQQGMNEGEAIANAVDGALEAAADAGPEAVARVEESLLPEAPDIDTLHIMDED